MKSSRFMLMLGLLTLPGLYLYAGDATVDLGISVSVTSAGVLLPGSEGVVNISITNYGPDSGRAALQLLQTPDGVGTSWPPLFFTEWFDGPCIISPIAHPGPGQTFPHWMTANLAAGETVVCSFGFVVTETSVKEQLARWRVSAGAGGQSDPNPDNNTAEALMRFARQTEALPVPVFSWFGMLLLIVLLSFISMRRL